MLTRRITGATRCLGAPQEWDPKRDGECGGLWIRMVQIGGNVCCESAWEPTPAELAALNRGGSVVLRIVGGQPPVAIYVEPPKED